MITASIVIYNNDIQMVSDVIHSFLKGTSGRVLYLVDNSPTDKMKFLAELYPCIIYIFNNANLGYGAGHNVAMRKAIQDGIKYHIVLNPDLVFMPEIIDKMSNYMDENETVGLSIPRMMNESGGIRYICKLLPAPIDLLSRRFSSRIQICKKRDMRYTMRFANYDEIIETPYVSGCFMFFRLSIFKEIELFDEKIFMYFEDTDISRRIFVKYKVVQYSMVECIHKADRAAYRDKKMLKIFIRSGIYYFNKWGWIFDKERRQINKKIIQKHI